MEKIGKLPLKLFTLIGLMVFFTTSGAGNLLSAALSSEAKKTESNQTVVATPVTPETKDKAVPGTSATVVQNSKVSNETITFLTSKSPLSKPSGKDEAVVVAKTTKKEKPQAVSVAGAAVKTKSDPSSASDSKKNQEAKPSNSVTNNNTKTTSNNNGVIWTTNDNPNLVIVFPYTEGAEYEVVFSLEEPQHTLNYYPSLDFKALYQEIKVNFEAILKGQTSSLKTLKNSGNFPPSRTYLRDIDDVDAYIQGLGKIFEGPGSAPDVDRASLSRIAAVTITINNVPDPGRYETSVIRYLFQPILVKKGKECSEALKLWARDQLRKYQYVDEKARMIKETELFIEYYGEVLKQIDKAYNSIKSAVDGMRIATYECIERTARAPDYSQAKEK